MTCIIGLVENGRVWMGGDAAAADSWETRPYSHPKIFEKSIGAEKCLVGCTTSFRMLQIVRYHINVMPPREGQDLMEWMVVDFAEAVRQAMKDYGFALIDRNREEGGYFLIGFRGHLFAVEKDFNVMELDDHLMAIGSGREYALGAMIALQDLPPEKRIYKALGIAGHWCTSVRGPYHVISEAA